MPVTAGIVGDTFTAAGITVVHMPTHVSSVAAHESIDYIVVLLWHWAVHVKVALKPPV